MNKRQQGDIDFAWILFELCLKSFSAYIFNDFFLLLSNEYISDLVNWILENVDGINDRREARKFIGNMLRKNYIRHTVNKLTFSENSYYQFGEGEVPGGCMMNEDDGELTSSVN